MSREIDSVFGRRFLGLDKKEEERKRLLTAYLSILGLSILVVLLFLAQTGHDIQIPNPEEQQLAQLGVVTIYPFEKDDSTSSEQPHAVNKIEIKRKLAETVTLKTWEPAFVGKKEVTITAYSSYDGTGENGTFSDGSKCEKFPYSCAVSRDWLGPVRLNNGQVINLREKIPNPVGTGMVYRYRIFVENFTPIKNDLPDWDKCLEPRDKMPKTKKLSRAAHKKFALYKDWKYLDGAGKPWVKFVVENWIDIYFNHPGKYSSIPLRCKVESWKRWPYHVGEIHIFELKPKYRRMIPKDGVIMDL